MGEAASEGRGTLSVGVDPGGPGPGAPAPGRPASAMGRAKVATAAAIKNGLLTPRPCERCGGWGQAHHDDYSKPLVVRWLCPIHHKEWHGANAGECCGLSKLKQWQVNEIRALYSGHRFRTLKAIGRDFGVSATSISIVLAGEGPKTLSSPVGPRLTGLLTNRRRLANWSSALPLMFPIPSFRWETL